MNSDNTVTGGDMRGDAMAVEEQARGFQMFLDNKRARLIPAARDAKELAHASRAPAENGSNQALSGSAEPRDISTAEARAEEECVQQASNPVTKRSKRGPKQRTAISASRSGEASSSTPANGERELVASQGIDTNGERRETRARAAVQQGVEQKGSEGVQQGRRERGAASPPIQNGHPVPTIPLPAEAHGMWRQLEYVGAYECVMEGLRCRV